MKKIKTTLLNSVSLGFTETLSVKEKIFARIRCQTVSILEHNAYTSIHTYTYIHVHTYIHTYTYIRTSVCRQDSNAVHPNVTTVAMLILWCVYPIQINAAAREGGGGDSLKQTAAHSEPSAVLQDRSL